MVHVLGDAMHKITIALASIAALIGTPVFAADMPVKARPAPAVIPPPVYNWTGCYLGGNIGGAWQHNSTFDAVAILATGGDRGNGLIGGAQIGCDYQLPIVGSSAFRECLIGPI